MQGQTPPLLHRDTPQEGEIKQTNENDDLRHSESHGQAEPNDQTKPVLVNTGKANRRDWTNKLSVIPVKVRGAKGDL